MKKQILGFLLGCAGYLQAQTDSIYQHYYLFRKDFIDLRTLQKIPTAQNEQINLHFKNTGAYAAYFGALTVDRLIYNGFYYDLTNNNGLSVTNPDTKIPQPVYNEDISSERYGQHFLFAADSGVILVKHLGISEGFKLYKYQSPAELLYKISIPHSIRVKTERSEYIRPYLQYLNHSQKELVFSSYDPKIPKTLRVNLSNGDTIGYQFSSKAVLFHPTSQQADGFLHLREDSLLINFADSSRAAIFAKKSEFSAYNSAEISQSNGLLGAVLYNRSGYGYLLMVWDSNTGKLRWEKRVAGSSQPNHYQKIWLSQQNELLMLEILDNSGRQLHIYNQYGDKKMELR